MKARTVQLLSGLLTQIEHVQYAMDPVNPELPTPYSTTADVVKLIYALVEILVLDAEGAP